MTPPTGAAGVLAPSAPAVTEVGAGAVSMWSDDGRRLPLDALRWHGEPSGLEQRLVADLEGPVLDVGCGPGRIVSALQALGTAALGHAATLVLAVRTWRSPPRSDCQNAGGTKVDALRRRG